ncbi:MAG: SHOCT domain-containing protein [Ignavibacteriae bacterium]|nr:SHOCT domain-containing protein [Ignavibacteriota bacterium]NOG99803.1 SHOCT domain-containing protein [Ignavibacteriota bacterium]
MFHDGFMGGGMWFGWVFWIGIIVLVGYLVVRLTNQKSNNQTIQSNETPLDVLKKRYARGEISKEEFESTKKDLE